MPLEKLLQDKVRYSDNNTLQPSLLFTIGKSYSHMILAIHIKIKNKKEHNHWTDDKKLNRSITFYHGRITTIQKCKNTYLFKLDNMKLTNGNLWCRLKNLIYKDKSNIYVSSTHIRISNHCCQIVDVTKKHLSHLWKHLTALTVFPITMECINYKQTWI